LLGLGLRIIKSHYIYLNEIFHIFSILIKVIMDSILRSSVPIMLHVIN